MEEVEEVEESRKAGIPDCRQASYSRPRSTSQKTDIAYDAYSVHLAEEQQMGSLDG